MNFLVEEAFTDIHELVEAFTALIDARHPYTKGHSDRVAAICLAISRQLNLSEKFGRFIHIAGHLHDIGKIGIPDIILLKPGKLTVREFVQIKAHSQIGYNILHKVKRLEEIACVIRHHHERWDGKGYPDGLQAKCIPLASRIIAVADSYDAMTSLRSYRRSLSHAEAIREMRRCSGSQFDPVIVAAFLEITRQQGLANLAIKNIDKITCFKI